MQHTPEELTKLFIEYHAKLHEIKEEWKLIEDTSIAAKMYYVSNYGRIYSKYTKKIIHPEIVDGCVQVLITHKNTKTYWYNIDNLVAKAFVPIPANDIKLGLSYDDLELSHINGINTCNAYFNLQWKHKRYHRLPVSAIHTICQEIEAGELSGREIARKYKLSSSTVNNIKGHRAHPDISHQYKF